MTQRRHTHSHFRLCPWNGRTTTICVRCGWHWTGPEAGVWAQQRAHATAGTTGATDEQLREHERRERVAGLAEVAWDDEVNEAMWKAAGL